VDLKACVSLPCFALQLLCRKHPEWKDLPVAVVSEEKPLATVLQLNREARRAGARTGMRYSAALALIPSLRAGTVSREQLQQAGGALLQLLHRFSPEVEPAAFEEGVFWLGAGGLERLFGSVERWVEELRRSLSEQGFHCGVAVGSSRFGTFAAARRSESPIIFSSPRMEREQALGAPLSILPFDPKTASRLRSLAVREIASLLRLPEGGVRLRFGTRAQRLYQFASELPLPLQPVAEERQLSLQTQLPWAPADAAALLQGATVLLHRLLADLHRAGELLHSLSLELQQQNGKKIVEEIRPAEPSADPELLRRLIRLRLQSLQLAEGVTRLALRATRVKVSKGQLELFCAHPRRESAQAAQAFALIRAELGNASVQRAVLVEEHLPERRYGWEMLQRLPPLQVRGLPVKGCRLIRRVFLQPPSLQQAGLSGSGRPGQLPDRGGPYELSGIWWEQEVRRRYLYLQTAGGGILWVYHDSKEGKWRLQGMVS
jgi:protein ImuB